MNGAPRSVQLHAKISRPVYDELVRYERATGVYRCRIVASLVTEGLISRVVDREIKRAASQPPEARTLRVSVVTARAAVVPSVSKSFSRSRFPSINSKAESVSSTFDVIPTEKFG